MKRGERIARRYARALFGLGSELGDPGALLAPLGELTDTILGNDDLRRLLWTPVHPRSERLALLVELARRLDLPAQVRGFAAFLIDRNRANLLPQIRDALHEMVERAAGRVEAEVSSARPLELEEVAELRETLARRAGAVVTLRLAVDPALIGGVVARLGDLRLDGSVRAQLAALRGGLEGAGG